ncbi:hypothetical protein [Mycobacterium uberis]|uniref:hypothetical protein n=1 Tax=Mycobacterium uberis TaxID=2162698 RepID=UPI000E308EAF|nr:hypothetical protein [Mycobacterium uberis]
MGGRQQNRRPAQLALIGSDRPPEVFGADVLVVVMELFMPKALYGFSVADKFLLATTVTLV